MLALRGAREVLSRTGGRWRTKPRPRVCGIEARRWFLPAGQHRLLRETPQQPSQTRRHPCHPDSPVLVVDTRRRASAARNEALQSVGDLGEVAAAAEACPALVTQVGLTRRSTAGLGRLLRRAGAPRGTVLLGSGGFVAPDGELELVREFAAPDQTPEVWRSPLGNGAVRLGWGMPRRVLTLGTRLPAVLLREHPPWDAGELLGSAWHVDDAAVLARLGRVEADPVEGVASVLCRPTGRRGWRLICVVDGPDADLPPDLWWVSAGGRARAKLSVDLAGGPRLLPRDIHDLAITPVVRRGALLPGSPLRMGAPVTAGATMAPGTVGPGSCGPLRAALLALRRRIEAGETVACAPVQAFRPGGPGARGGRGRDPARRRIMLQYHGVTCRCSRRRARRPGAGGPGVSPGGDNDRVRRGDGGNPNLQRIRCYK